MLQPVGRLGQWLAALGLTLALALLLTGVAAGMAFVRALGPLDLASTQARSPVVVDRNGVLLRAFTTADGRWRLPVGVGDVDPRFVALLKTYEDRRFDHHSGVDGWALARAAGQILLHGRIVSGGSTLTMQVARLIEPRAERSLAAKARQIVRAWQLETRLSKDEILGLYLSLAPYGGNIEGIRAASFAYFGKEPKRLSLGEAALLVALPQSPEGRRPDRFDAIGQAARDRVIARAVSAGLVTPLEAHEASAEPVPQARERFPMLAAHLAEQLHAAAPNRARHETLIDASLQASIETMLRDRVRALGPKLSAAAIVVDNATGAIRARVGAADYLDAERQGPIDMTGALRSPGSALKPLVYAMAFEDGIAHPETIVEDRPSRFGAWAPENFDDTFHGTLTARQALQLSLNVPAVDLLSAVGPARFLARLRASGAEIALPSDASPGLAVVLGGLGTRLVDLARLSAMLARGGEAISLRQTPEDPIDLPARIIDPVAAWYVWDTLKSAPPPTNAASGRIAFKTGTSYGYRDAWAIGYDRALTIAIWVGRPDGVSVPGLIGRQVAAPLLFEAYARAGATPEPLPRPRHVLVATSATLPPPLRHLRPDLPKTVAATTEATLRIAYPPNGARVDLGLSAGVRDAGPLALKASGGVPPLRWLVNGHPVESNDGRRQTVWQPDGAGFAELSVIDAHGATASATVRLD
jgi:penicillin-binding protein 1C